VSSDGTITEQELAGAIGALIARSGIMHPSEAMWVPGEPVKAAASLFALVRESEYEPGEIYQDPTGRAWCRMRRDDGGEASWRCCESGTLYSDRYPPKPLRKLIPEPLPAARVEARQQYVPLSPGTARACEALITGEQYAAGLPDPSPADGAAARLLALPLPGNRAGALDVRRYLAAILTGVWRDPSGFFCGAEPFPGEEDWQAVIYVAMIRAGLVAGTVTDDGVLVTIDRNPAGNLIAAAIAQMGVTR